MSVSIPWSSNSVTWETHAEERRREEERQENDRLDQWWASLPQSPITRFWQDAPTSWKEDGASFGDISQFLPGLRVSIFGSVLRTATPRDFDIAVTFDGARGMPNLKRDSRTDMTVSRDWSNFVYLCKNAAQRELETELPEHYRLPIDLHITASWDQLWIAWQKEHNGKPGHWTVESCSYITRNPDEGRDVKMTAGASDWVWGLPGHKVVSVCGEPFRVLDPRQFPQWWLSRFIGEQEAKKAHDKANRLAGATK
jgi:hypothetical protein